jgi:N-acetylglucosamine-6-phosphate deacetylase
VTAPRIVTSAGIISPGTVIMENGLIVDVLRGGTASEAYGVRLTSGTLVRGFVDLQVNGFAGVDLASADSHSYAHMTRMLARAGTTSFLPTLITAPLAVLVERVRHLALTTCSQTPGHGARAVGLHIEGPFLSPARPGAHRPEWLQLPTPATVRALVDAGAGHIAILTLAPELKGAIDAVRSLTDERIVASIGHSDATARQTAAAIDAGARMITHLFNAQRGMHHREPGVVGAALADDRVVCGLIADLHHVAAEACAVAFRAAVGRIALVSDASAAAGMPLGRYELGTDPIELRDDGRATRGNGVLAGSSISLADGVARSVSAGINLLDAVRSATTVPADLLGRRDIGRIEFGARADLVWLSDELRPRATWIDGRRVNA